MALVATFKKECKPLPENRLQKKAFQFVKSISIFLVPLHRFFFRKMVSKMLDFQFFTSKTTFGGYFEQNVSAHFQKSFSWTRYDIPNQSEIHKLFWLHSFIFDLQ